jgi:hypothetical protein
LAWLGNQVNQVNQVNQGNQGNQGNSGNCVHEAVAELLGLVALDGCHGVGRLSLVPLGGHLHEVIKK